ncbi:hypothetical protein H6G33_30925 [Calothrix sp. FACHB-1219]|uniref:hypothetical protein n=1 Tax=unclassified Calothrix TaxID=2619626 RepID=UPI001688FD80|nr:MULTISPECIES: hypothetical protein [unclassified Calothrix]MBD2206593.1 hypothetical protein [Calothrix sp. FACHB-168]MBD2221388.1 hypothetical protein [Calothrix sp. FACHB-1219]
MLAFVSEQDARTTLDYQNEFIKWYGYLRHAALVLCLINFQVCSWALALYLSDKSQLPTPQN